MLAYAELARQTSFTPGEFTALLTALVDHGGSGGGDPVLATGALLRCTGPVEPEAVRLAGKLVTAHVTQSYSLRPLAVLALAALSGSIPARIVSKVTTWSLHPIGKDEIGVLSAAGPAALALLAEVAEPRPYDAPPELPDAWERLAETPGYPAFARRALEAARDRLAGIHAGRVAYRADAAFEKDEVAALGRAARTALLRDEPWLLDVLRPLLLQVAVAPTAAKTLPSQALLYEVARAAEALPTPEVLAALREARGVARHRGVHQQLDRKLQRIGRALGDRPDVALRLPDLGFDRDGVLVVPVGSHRAVITLCNGVELGWDEPGGRMPATVRRDHPDAVKDVRKLVTRIRGHLATLSRSLEAGFATAHALPLARWREELAGSALGWAVVSRLIWEIPDGTGGWQAVLPKSPGGAFMALGGAPVPEPAFGGAPVPEPAPGAAIRLWHPLRASPGEVQAWRDLLTARELRQPLKQAFREIYPLTPAETETATYSNRFAAHIVHHKQLFALFKARGWTAPMLGPWDGGDTGEATRVMAGGSWRVTLRHDYRDDAYATTDRVWLDRRAGAGWRTVPLAEVPPLVLSEALRDVDLFVSVTSIAADPEWYDRGDDLYRDYWLRQSDAPLTATAEVRRSALARILPRTKIADRCELTERHLVVRGGLHTYRIHLGSGNIQMGSTYLCIVPARRRAEPVFVPFEDDRLTVILSKAFLLSGDVTITDPSIVAQLRGSRG